MLQFNRRTFLTTASAALVASTASGLPALAYDQPDPSRENSRLDQMIQVIHPELRMVNANTGDRMSVTFFEDGAYNINAIGRINWFMRDWRQQEIREVDLRLIWSLAAIRQAAMRDGHDGEIRFFSGYRSRTTNDLLRSQGRGAARNSFHILARAIDFTLPGIPVATTFEFARWLQIGGVGHYPNSFVHIDSGEVRTWRG